MPVRPREEGEEVARAPMGDGQYTSPMLRTVDVGGIEVPWCGSGAGAAEAVVLLPGLGWRATGSGVLGYLGSGVSAVALDYPRRWPREPLDSMADLGRLYAAAIERIARAPVRLTGVSMGGMLALQLARDRPDLLASVAIVSASARGRPAGRWRLPGSRLTTLVLTEGAFHGFYRRWGPALVGTGYHAAPREAARLWTDPMSRRKMRDLLRAVHRFDVRDGLGAIRVPTLVVHGDRDAIFPLARAEEVVAGIAGASLAVLRGAGHFAFLTHADAVRERLHQFWREADR
ncbi:MAG: alpha/beta hydrolase [Gemmatimonadetes bacterium]|nr:alpha/beta hydrolase [Gemmatimonadota bacterium]